MCIKLVINTCLNHDARSEKHQTRGILMMLFIKVIITDRRGHSNYSSRAPIKASSAAAFLCTVQFRCSWLGPKKQSRISKSIFNIKHLIHY